MRSTKYLLGLSFLFLIGLAYFVVRRPSLRPESLQTTASFSVSTPKEHADSVAQAQSSGASKASQNSTPESVQALSPSDAQKMIVLKEIFKLKNDNDSRLDTEFKNMSAQLKAAMKAEYKQNKPENRNERGTIVFLLARDLKSVDEIAFFKEVLNEPPCFSLADCKQIPPAPRGEEAHLESLNQTTLAYPQIVALRMNEQNYNATTDVAVREALAILFKEAAQSSVQKVAQEARAIIARLKL